MKPFIFISDFDNTISEKDFYWILLDDYIGEEGVDFYKAWKKTKKIGTEFLNQVFAMYRLTDEEYLEALDKVRMDKDLEKVVAHVTEKGGDFHLCSAGFDLYIQHALARRGLEHLSLHTNKGIFKDGTFIMTPDKASRFYSDVYGIDKEKVALYYKAQTEKLYFAGDSEPDYWAARHGDVIFAKEELAAILDKEGRAYYPYEDFADILKYLEAGV